MLSNPYSIQQNLFFYLQFGNSFEIHGLFGHDSQYFEPSHNVFISCVGVPTIFTLAYCSLSFSLFVVLFVVILHTTEP